MFIKIKLDKQNESEMDYVEIPDDAFLSEIAEKLQPYINVAAEDMEIRTLGKVYRKEDKFTNIWKKDETQGCVVMLFTYNYEKNLEPQFHCFLQLFESETALRESCSMKMRPVRQISNTTSTSKCSSDVTLIANLDSEDEQQGDNEKNKTLSDTESTTSSESSSSCSNSSTYSNGSDRSTICTPKKGSVEGKSKRNAQSQHTKMPSKLAKYLDEFPNYNVESTEVLKPDTATKLPDATTIEKDTLNNLHDTVLKSRSVSAPSNPTNSYELLETATKSILPENREYIVLVLKASSDCIEKEECLPILNIFFKQFHGSKTEQVAALNFNDNDSAFKLHDGKLWIVCEDEITFGWIMETSKELPSKYRAEKFKDYFKLTYYNVTIPNICDANDMLIVFQLLQKQNANVNMSLWTVAQRRQIAGKDGKHFEKTVCHFCSNDLLSIGIDRNSVEQLGKEFSLKYCFWKLEFKQENLN